MSIVGREIRQYNLSGKIILVTGGNNDIGKETIKQLAKHDLMKIYMGARCIERAEEAILDIKKEVPSANIIILKLDLASFSSIKTAADAFLAENDHLDVLINNAGVFARPLGLTMEGYEIQFGTNYMGSALLTWLLLLILDKTARTEVSRDDVQIVNSVALHPGLVQINIGVSMTANPILSFFFNLFTSLMAIDVPTGALNQLWVRTTSYTEVKSGAYYIPTMKEVDRADTMNDGDKAEKLWQWTEREFEKHGF